MELSDSLRLWGGLASIEAKLRARLQSADLSVGPVALGATAIQALALLRLAFAGVDAPADIPRKLPLHTISSLRPHLATLSHMGCNTWGDLQVLPRAGIARRFGAQVLLALDQALGVAPHGLDWVVLPETFDVCAELPALADSAPALLHAASRMLQALHAWLLGRQQGVLVLEFSWTHDLRRFDGVDLPPTQALPVRTARPTRDIAHLRRLLGEHLARTALAAPVNQIRLRVLQSACLPHSNVSLIVESERKATGMSWHELIERLGARLGAKQVQMVEVFDDHRPEAMQRWHGAADAIASGPPTLSASYALEARLFPSWLVRPVKALAVWDGQPWHHGRLQLLVGPQRLETGWWCESDKDASSPALAVRDYFVAHNETVGLVWIYRERLPRSASNAAERTCWFLQGIYA